MKSNELKTVTNILSAGICDSFAIPKMVNTGDGTNEPLNPILYCNKIKIEMRPSTFCTKNTDKCIECFKGMK